MSRRRRRYYIPLGCVIPALLLVLAFLLYFLVPFIALRTYGPYSDSLNPLQRVQYSALLLWYDGLLTNPVDRAGTEEDFKIAQGEDAATVASQLEQSGLIQSADAFRVYLIYSGLDTSIQAGDYSLTPALSGIQIAQRLQDATPADVKFVVLAGWRIEEIAGSLSTAGLSATPESFLTTAQHPPESYDFLPSGASAEGFLLPGTYTLPRATTADQLVASLMRNFSLALTEDLKDGFSRQGLSIYQAVTLASIVQREAVVAEEQPVIASVFLNRLKAGMKLEADPTVQYALGFDVASTSWWKSPLSLDDLKVNSPFNTYVIDGLPPAPIDNPSMGALQAVAKPAQTSYYFFRARCDGSNRHTFSETFEQHLQNTCP